MKYYPLKDRPTRFTVKELANLRACATGEIRPPKKGEWYLSGAIVEAYKAPNDLSDAFPIATIVSVSIKQVEKITPISILGRRA